MASKPTIAVMGIVLLGIIAASVVPAAFADADFVASTCKSSDNPQCAAVLGTDPRSVNATTVRELASIALDIANGNAVSSTSYLSGEADRRYRTDEGDALEECVRQYNAAVDALAAARDAFDSGAYGEAEQQSGAAEDAGARCEQAFTDRQLKSLVSDVDKRMNDWTGVASDLIDLLYVDAKAKRSGGRRLLRA